MTTLRERLLPPAADNRFAGQRAALWLLGAYLALKLAMGFNMIANGKAVARTADGIPLDRFPPAAQNEVLLLFALVALGQLALAAAGLVALARYRSLVPLSFVLLIAESVARRAIVAGFDVERSASGGIGTAINLGLIAWLVLGLGLSLWPRRTR